MKKISILLFFTILGLAVIAQDEEYDLYDDNQNEELRTLFNSNTHGGFGGVSLMYSEINNLDALYIGGRGGWIIGHHLSIGLGGNMYFSFIDNNPNRDSLQYNIMGGHGGLYLEPIILPKFPVHLSLPLFVGAGGIGYYEYSGNEFLGTDEHYAVDSKAYFIFEPGAEVEFNMLRHFRMALGVYYTITTETKLDYIDNEDLLSNLKFGLTLKFGQF